ncbi:10714_t:CDS:2, partial [Rhizophagus irregularis]
KIAFTRISKPTLPLKQREYIQESITRFGYSLDITTTFKFSFCLACNSAFQRKKSNTNSKSSTPCKISLEFDSNRNSSEDDKPAQTRSNSIDLNESDDKDNDNIEITLPSKWMEIEVSSLDDILADIHLCVKKLTEKNTNMAVIMSLKNDKKKKQRGRKENLYSEDSEDENIDLQKKKRKEIPKVDNFSEILQQEGRIIQELRKQYKSSNSNFNTPFFFAISPQMFSFMQNPTTNNSPNSPSNVLSYPRQSVPSLDEFFIKLDESLDGNEEFTTKFKDIFKEE